MAQEVALAENPEEQIRSYGRNQVMVKISFNQKQQNKLRKEREAEREIYNKQLTEALQAAQVAGNSKTMFLSNMSHDIRTLMNAVLGFTTLLARCGES